MRRAQSGRAEQPDARDGDPRSNLDLDGHSDSIRHGQRGHEVDEHAGDDGGAGRLGIHERGCAALASRDDGRRPERDGHGRTGAPSVGGAAARRPTANAASAGFAPPPRKATASPPNSGGIARIVSSQLGLDNYIDVLSVVDNQMEAPDNDGSYAVGWYAAFDRPGVPGNAIFSAHETWNHFQGPFYFMHAADVGNELYLDMANGQRYTYRVISASRYTVDTIPMGDVIWPSTRPADEQWITPMASATTSTAMSSC